VDKNRTRLEGKVAIVTGAGRGIGQAIAIGLANEGANVIVNDVNLESARSVADEIKHRGGQALAIKADVSSNTEVIQMVKQTVDKFGKINILVNNAGISGFWPTLELTEVEWDRVLNTNLKSQFLCSQAVGKEMVKQKEGKIINIGATRLGQPGLAAYNASKAGVLALTRVLAVEWAKYNINVNVVRPGLTETPLVREALAKLGPGVFERRLKRYPMRRVIEPASIAKVVVFLASSEANDITGQEIVVDCGISALQPSWVWPDE